MQQNGDSDVKTKVIRDIPISENGIIRISNKEYRGRPYTDLRLFQGALEDDVKYAPSIQGVLIEGELLGEVIEGFRHAKNKPSAKFPEGAYQHRTTAHDCFITEWDIYRFYKLYRDGNYYIEIRKMTIDNERKWKPYIRKGAVIEMRFADQVIEGLEQAKQIR